MWHSLMQASIFKRFRRGLCAGEQKRRGAWKPRPQITQFPKISFLLPSVIALGSFSLPVLRRLIKTTEATLQRDDTPPAEQAGRQKHTSDATRSIREISSPQFHIVYRRLTVSFDCWQRTKYSICESVQEGHGMQTQEVRQHRDESECGQ